MQKIKTRELILIFLVLFLIVFSTGISLSKYVFTDNKQIVGIYTDFVLTHSGEGQTAVIRTDSIESDHGYVAVSVNNFNAEKVSKRNVRFSLRTPTAEELEAGKVIDAWGNEHSLESDSDKYEVNIVKDDGGEYSADELSALTFLPANVKTQKSLLLDIHRKDTAGEFNADGERFSVILETSEPYRDLQVFSVNTTKARLSLGITTDTYQGYTQKTVNLKSSTDFIESSEVISTANYKAEITFTLENNVMFDAYRFNESYPNVISAFSGNSYTFYIEAGADVNLYFYTTGVSKVTVSAKIYDLDGGAATTEQISGVGSDGIVFSTLS